SRAMQQLSKADTAAETIRVLSLCDRLMRQRDKLRQQIAELKNPRPGQSAPPSPTADFSPEAALRTLTKKADELGRIRPSKAASPAKSKSQPPGNSQPPGSIQPNPDKETKNPPQQAQRKNGPSTQKPDKLDRLIAAQGIGQPKDTGFCP